MANAEHGWTDIIDYTSANIQALRRKSGRSRKDVLKSLDDMAGVKMHETTLRRIEEGTQHPKALEVAGLARVFHVGIDDLITKPVDPRMAEAYSFVLACKEALKNFESSTLALIEDLTDSWQILEELKAEGVAPAGPYKELLDLLLDNRSLVKSIVEFQEKNGLPNPIENHPHNGWWERSEG